MKVLKTAVIIPNETVLNVPVYCEDSLDLFHVDMIKKFANLYNLEVTDEYDLVEKGHIFLRAVDDLVICYIPGRITEKQFERLLQLRSFLERYERFTASILGNNELVIENISGEYDWTNKNIIDYFYDMVKKECLESRGLNDGFRKVS